MFKQINEIKTWKSKLFSAVKYKILLLYPKKLTNNIIVIFKNNDNLNEKKLKKIIKHPFFWNSKSFSPKCWIKT